MRFIISCFAIAAVLSTSAARAEGDRAPAPPAAVQATPYAADADLAAPRIFLEGISGGLGAVAGGFIGFNVGASSDNLAAAGWGLMGGAALGAWLGTSLGGGLAGGSGNMGFTFLGTAAGSLTSMVVILALGPNATPELVLGSAALLPVVGAILGYELSQDPGSARSRRSSFRFMPTVSILLDGKGASTGLVGTF